MTLVTAESTPGCTGTVTVTVSPTPSAPPGMKKSAQPLALVGIDCAFVKPSVPTIEKLIVTPARAGITQARASTPWNGPGSGGIGSTVIVRPDGNTLCTSGNATRPNSR